MVPYEIDTVDGSDCYVATVLAFPDEQTKKDAYVTGKIPVHIPKLMPMLPEGQYTVQNIQTSNNKIQQNIVKETVKTSNGIWVRAKELNDPIPLAGSKVLVDFIDGDINKGYWSPFNTYGIEYKEDPDDKFIKDKLFDINFVYANDTGAYIKSISVHKGDTLTFQFGRDVTIDASRKDSNVEIIVKSNKTGG